jgi:hypothetical protein
VNSANLATFGEAHVERVVFKVGTGAFGTALQYTTRKRYTGNIGFGAWGRFFLRVEKQANSIDKNFVHILKS